LIVEHQVLDVTATNRLRLIADYAKPLLRFLLEPKVLDICVNVRGDVWVNRLDSGWKEEEYLKPETSYLLLSTIATVQRLDFSERSPILETILPLTGDRIEGIISPVVPEPVVAIRTRAKQIYTLRNYDEQNVLSVRCDPLNLLKQREEFFKKANGLRHVDVLRLATVHRQNILIVGATGSGKSTLANGIMADWFEQTPDDRIVIIEDTVELQCSSPNYVQMLAKSGVANQAKLLETALRLIPKRIVVGEVRSSEPARVLLEAWNTGHRGGLATIHADDALSGLRKMESFVGSHSAVVREQIAAAIGLVVFIDADDRISSGRKVREIMVVRGFDVTRQDYDLVKV
jgi:type IV secretion system protein VirB11